MSPTPAAAPIDADALRTYAEETQSSRRFCAVLWAFVLAFAGVATAFSDPMGVTLSVIGAFITMLLTLAMAKPSLNERLVRPRLYRAVTGAFVLLTLFGAALAAVPGANDTTKVLATYFGLAALLGYRALVATGPRAAFVAVTLAMVSLIPFVLLMLMTVGCRREPYVPSWTLGASGYTLEIMLLALPVVAVAALLAFRPRHDFVPDAVVIRR